VIWNILHSSRTHLTAEDLHGAALSELPDLSRGTVYRTLVGLVADTWVREIATVHGSSWYEAICADDVHSDVVCNVCGRIEKLPSTALARAASVATMRSDLQLTAGHVVIYGTCRTCSPPTHARRN
jgi:Fe2+ or Zn2+ uptake regulation protein